VIPCSHAKTAKTQRQGRRAATQRQARNPNDSALFETRAELEALGARFEDGVWVVED
jgi:hypothetical protein